MKKTEKVMKILIVDDVAAAHLLYKHALKNEKYEIIDAERGKDALAIIGKRDLDLVILDLDLPDMSGLEVLEEMRNSGNEVPVIMLTAYGTKEYVVKAAAKGVNYYLLKPVELGFLRKRVEEALSPAESEKKFIKIKNSTKLLMESLSELDGDAALSNHVDDLKNQIKEIVSKLGEIEKEKPVKHKVDTDSFFNKEVVCPVCASDFQAVNYKAKSFKFIRRDADFHEVYEGGYSPIMFDIWVCPECLYAAKKDDFAKIKVKDIEKIVRDKNDRIKLADGINFREFRNYRSAKISYILAAKCYEKIGFDYEYVANLYLRSAWIAREEKSTSEEKNYIKLSLSYFQKMIENKAIDTTLFPETTIYYLMGELYRRVGDFENGEKSFKLVIDSENKDRDKNIVKMAAVQYEQLKLERTKSGNEDSI